MEFSFHKHTKSTEFRQFALLPA